MAIKRKYGIIRMTAATDKISDEDLHVEGILIQSTAAGAFVVNDGDSFIIAAFNSGTGQLSKYIPINRRIKGIEAKTLPTGSLTVYLRQHGL